jgi:hypothetical protein
MKRVFLSAMLLVLASIAYSQGKYPIKTIFKGDSVVILTIEQSENINKAIEKNSKAVKDNGKKMQEKDLEIQRLNQLLLEQNAYIDSLSNLLLSQIDMNDSLVMVLDSVYRIGKNEKGIADSLWRWALGPTLIYTQYPDDDNIYLFDLSHYYMTTDDFGIMMAKMNDRDYKKYEEFINTYGLDEKAIWKFKNEMNIEYLSKSKMEEKRVWKYKLIKK